MSEQSSVNDPHGGDSERQPLFDPYTGERLKPLDAGSPAPVAPSGSHRRDEDVLVPSPPAPPPTGKRSRAKVSAIVLVVALICAGAGLVWWLNGPHARAQRDADRRAAAAAEAKRAATCKSLLQDTYSALQSINSRLDVGMVEADYTSAVGEAQAKYDQVDASRATASHCGAYDSMHRALTQYSKASTYWNNCIISDYCTPSDARLNTYWSRSSSILDSIKSDGLGAKPKSDKMIPTT